MNKTQRRKAQTFEENVEKIRRWLDKNYFNQKSALCWSDLYNEFPRWAEKSLGESLSFAYAFKRMREEYDYPKRSFRINTSESNGHAEEAQMVDTVDVFLELLYGLEGISSETKRRVAKELLRD